MSGSQPTGTIAAVDDWPALPLDAWQDTYATLHRWTQIVGKVRLELMPRINHCWQTTLYVSSRGLTTSPMPYGNRQVELEFDFIEHRLRISCTNGEARSIALEPRSVADFYQEVMATLRAMELEIHIWPMPVEISDPIRFEEDHTHASYDREYVERFFQILQRVEQVFTTFRGRFQGKCSPVHFFWGAFDLAVTRFSGRLNPQPPTDAVMADAYSHEVISHGFWPGGAWPTGGKVDGAAFYAYAVPEPQGFREASVKPAAARYNENFGEYLLMYDEARSDEDPARTILDFMQSTYEAGANAANWDRTALER